MPEWWPSAPGLDVGLSAGTLRVAFDRPETHNALSGEMALALADLLEQVPTRDDVRIVLIRGTGGSFCAGADIAGDDAHERFDVRAMDVTNRIIRAIVACDRPVVAAVDGVAAGVGCSIALACDLVVAAASSSYLLAFTRIGFMPDGGASATVAASIGRARAMRMALLAEPLTAEEAYAAGLVSHLVDDDSFHDLVDKLTARLASGPPLAYAATKKAVNAAALGPLEGALERERTGQVVLMRTADVTEGMRAFSQRRRPVFRGE